MAESTKPGRRRARRSTEVSRALEAARKRNAEQLAKQRQQEETVLAALGTFFDAGDQIAAAEAECRRRVQPHEQAIAQLHEQRDKAVAAHGEAQGLAALEIHEADRTVEQVGELLGLGEKAARRLIATGREAKAKSESGGQEPDGGTPTSDTAAVRPDPGADDDRGGEHVAAAPEGAGAASSGGESWPAGSDGGDGEQSAAPPAPGAVSA
jgi:hypothetical protein